MCGIFAFLNNHGQFNPKFIHHHFQKGRARGPDTSALTREMNGVILGFHRLSINGLTSDSDQPLWLGDIALICNGEIYNYHALVDALDCEMTTESDCEVILHLYARFGIRQTLRMIDGEFAFVIADFRDINTPAIHVCRDPFGVRPMYTINGKYVTCFASDLKQITAFKWEGAVGHFPPGTIYTYTPNNSKKHTWCIERSVQYYTPAPCILGRNMEIADIYEGIRHYFSRAVQKRCINTHQPFGCLLSGGLDSSLVCALAALYGRQNNSKPLRTFSIGLKDSEDLMWAKRVSEHIGSQHHEVVLTEQDCVDAIEEVIYATETCDTTTIRASIGNYLIAKYIRNHTDIRVVLNGDGSDELCGGYLYMHAVPDTLTFDHECVRLLREIHAFDVLRSDKCMGAHGLEARTPFLDREWVDFYMSIPAHLRNHVICGEQEKYLLRGAFDTEDDMFLPNDVLWRRKEAFSDGVSKQSRSLYTILQEAIEQKDFKYVAPKTHIMPKTIEQMYYKSVFETHFSGCESVIPHYWMPRFVDANDASARTLDIYRAPLES